MLTPKKSPHDDEKYADGKKRQHEIVVHTHRSNPALCYTLLHRFDRLERLD